MHSFALLLKCIRLHVISPKGSLSIGGLNFYLGTRELKHLNTMISFYRILATTWLTIESDLAALVFRRKSSIFEFVLRNSVFVFFSQKLFGLDLHGLFTAKLYRESRYE